MLVMFSVSEDQQLHSNGALKRDSGMVSRINIITGSLCKSVLTRYHIHNNFQQFHARPHTVHKSQLKAKVSDMK